MIKTSIEVEEVVDVVQKEINYIFENGEVMLGDEAILFLEVKTCPTCVNRRIEGNMKVFNEGACSNCTLENNCYEESEYRVEESV